MLVIRLARGGRKKYPVYRIVAADQRRAATGKNIAVLGNYNPHTKELSLKHDEMAAFIKNGAQPSDAVLRLMQKDGMELPKWASITVKNRKPKKEPEAEAENPADAKIEDAPEGEATVEVASEAADTTESVAEETSNVDSAAAEEVKAEADTTEAVADAAVETAQEVAAE